MATFTFDGTASQSVAFDPTADQLVFNLPAAGIANVLQDATSVTFIAVSGAVLTLEGVQFADLGDSNFIAGTGSDIVVDFGTTGNDPALLGNIVVGQSGNDGLTASSDGALLLGNQGTDVLNSTGFDNVRMYGGQNADVINFLSSATADDASLLVGGLGSDTINVGYVAADGGFVPGTAYAGNITVYGGNESNDPADDSDVINVNLAADGAATVYGNGGDDVITVVGGGTADIFGGQGNDTVVAELNGGSVVGGLGSDTITVNTLGDDASVTVVGGNGTNDPADGADTITVNFGSAGDAATVFGNGGDDVLGFTGTGQVTAYGGQGNDIIAGAAEDGTVDGSIAASITDGSQILGGLGIDTINVSVDGAGATPEVGANATIWGGNGTTDPADGADIIDVAIATGNTATIYGNGGDDVITVTGAGNASVFGGQGDDTINVSGSGQYALTGGQGADTFDFSGAATVAGDATALSSVTDFAFGDDTIVFGTGGAATSVVTVAGGEASSAADIFGLANGGAGVVSLVTVGGDLAGTYAVFGEQAINITGFTGAVDAASFQIGSPPTAELLG